MGEIKQETWAEKFRRECEDLHVNIEYGLDHRIHGILKEFPNKKRFYNNKMQSAAAVALKHKQIKIYGLLLLKGVCLGPHEDANEIISEFDPRMKRIIQVITMKNSIEVADHISILISKSRISHNFYESEISEMEQCIRQAFIDLDQIPRIQPILKVVAYADKLSINFDFYDDKIKNMVPTRSNVERGCSCSSGRWEGHVFIGAKGLMRGADEKYFVVLGTLVHELSHYAMQLLYQNHCKPYKCFQDNKKALGEPAEKLRKTEELSKNRGAGEISDEDRFSEICKKCKENCKADDSEPCVNLVFFRYPEPQQHCELIVRVPQLLALHNNDEAKLIQVESTYSELFNFFEEKILPNIESVLPRMKTIYKLNQAYQSKHQSIEHYVERKFIRPDENFENLITEDQLIDHSKNERILLLSDEPGAGKTTNLIAMAGKLKKRYPDHWIVVIDLKEFAEHYKRDGDKSTTFSTPSEIENYYCEKIFKFKYLETKNFAKLFEDNRVIFLMDGFDEISPSYKKFNLKLIKATRKFSSKIWISTRPHLEKQLQSKLKCSVFRLKPFTTEDRRKFLELKWKFEIDKKMLDEKIQKVETILDEIIEKSKGLDPTSNPLILTMISEILDDLSNQKNSQMNLYSIYETFVKKKKKIFFKKGPEAEEQMMDDHYWLNIKVFHHEIALRTILDNAEFVNRSDIWSSLCGRTNLPSPEEIARLGLMVYVENSNAIYKNFRFLHRTFAEYFVADFIIEGFSKFDMRENYGTNSLDDIFSLYNDFKGFVRPEKMFNLILEKYLFYSSTYSFSSDSSRAMVRYFIYSFYETRSHFDSFRHEKLQNFEKALNFPGRFFRNLFHAALEDGSDCFLKDVPETLEVKLRSVEFWKPLGPRPLMMLSAKHSASFFSEILEFINKFLDPEILTKMFFDVDDKKRNILWHCPLETFKLILSDSPMISLSRQEKEELLLEKDDDGFHVLLFYVTCKTKEEFKKYYEVVNDFDKKMPEKLLNDFSLDKYQSILHCLILLNDYYFESSLEIVREFFELSSIKKIFKINDGFPAFLMLLARQDRYVEKYKIFWNFFEKIFEDAAERISIMRQEDAEGFSTLDFAFFECGWREDDDLVAYIKEKYEIVYSEKEMRQRIIGNIFSFLEANKVFFLKSRHWHLDTLMRNIMSAFSKDFVRSLFFSCGKPIFLKDGRAMSVLKPLLIENLIFSEDEIDKLF